MNPLPGRRTRFREHPKTERCPCRFSGTECGAGSPWDRTPLLQVEASDPSGAQRVGTNGGNCDSARDGAA